MYTRCIAFGRARPFAWRRAYVGQRKARADVHPLDTGPFLLRLVAGFAAASFLWLVCAELGIRLVGPWIPNRPAKAALGAALGYAAVGSVIALLGAFHAATTNIVVALVIVIALLRATSYLSVARRVPEGLASLRAWYRSLFWLSRCALYVAAFAAVTGAVAAALPAVWWDPIAYHLPIASAALASGTFHFDPGMIQSAFPALGEASALPAYALAGSAGAAMATLFAGIALALLCGALAEELAAGTGPLAGALVMSSALWLWLAPSFYVDVPFALFAVGAIAVPMVTGRGESGAIDDRAAAYRAIVIGALCGALAGAAAAVKYPGLVVAVVALGMLMLFPELTDPRSRSRDYITKPRVSLFGGFAFGFVVIAVGWYARNAALTGDPLYPFLAAALRFPEPIVAFASRYIDMTRHWCGGGNGFVDLLTLPWRLLADPRSFCGDPGYALRLGVIFAIVCIATIRRSWPIAIACIALTLFWFESSQQWRFLAPSLALFAVLAAAGTAGLSQRLRDLGGAVLLALGALGVLVNWIPATMLQASDSIVPGYAYIAGREDGAPYVGRRLETYSAARFLAAGLPGRHIREIAQTSVISLDDVRTYYFWGGIAWANSYYQQIWNLDWTAPPSKRYAALRAHGFRYLIVNASTPYVHRTPTGVDWKALSGDVAAGALKKVFADGDVAIYDIGEAR